MNVGDIVVASPGNPLHDSHHVYSHAICVSIDPLVLVSQDGGMMWTDLKADEVIALSQASPAACRNAFERWEKESYAIKGRQFVDGVLAFAKEHKDDESVSRTGLFIALETRDRARDPFVIRRVTEPLEKEISRARMLLSDCLDSLQCVTKSSEPLGARNQKIKRVRDFLNGEYWD